MVSFTINHLRKRPPLNKMHSLVSPSDRTNKPYQVKAVEPLPDDDVVKAMETLNKDLKFAQVDRYYADPNLPNQKIALVSFVPSKGATPDKDNIYGMMKVRGVFATEEEANERAEFLIRNVDSYHDVFHAYVGRPFPVTSSDGFSNELKTIDIRKKTTELISQDILSKKASEKKEMTDIQDREKNLLEESKRAAAGEAPDPFDTYITTQVKRAQLAWTYHETLKKMDQMKVSYNSTAETIQELDKEHPDFIDRYKDQYMKARTESGIPEDHDSFIKYLGLDLTTVIEDAPSFLEKKEKDE